MLIEGRKGLKQEKPKASIHVVEQDKNDGGFFFCEVLITK